MTPQHVSDLSLLPAIRVAQGISLEQVSEVTKIGVATLQAIETGHFELLPGGFYDISYIRQYAHEIGVEESELLGLYNARMHPQPQPPTIDEARLPDRVRRFCNRLADRVLSLGQLQATATRVEPRFAPQQPAQVTVIGGAATSLVSGTVLDISRSGVGIRVPALIALGSALRVEVGNLIAHCEVRNCRKNSQGTFDIGLKVGRVLSKSGPVT